MDGQLPLGKPTAINGSCITLPGLTYVIDRSKSIGQSALLAVNDLKLVVKPGQPIL